MRSAYVMRAEAYRKAVDLNPRDYRAWYGLGQTYELLHMPVYALHYYQRATQVPHAFPHSSNPVPSTGPTRQIPVKILLELCCTTVMWGPTLEGCQTFKAQAQQTASTGCHARH